MGTRAEGGSESRNPKVRVAPELRLMLEKELGSAEGKPAALLPHLGGSGMGRSLWGRHPLQELGLPWIWVGEALGAAQSRTQAAGQC